MSYLTPSNNVFLTNFILWIFLAFSQCYPQTGYYQQTCWQYNWPGACHSPSQTWLMIPSNFCFWVASPTWWEACNILDKNLGFELRQSWVQILVLPSTVALSKLHLWTSVSPAVRWGQEGYLPPRAHLSMKWDNPPKDFAPCLVHRKHSVKFGELGRTETG